jgi:hypothetical protein
MPQFDYDYDGLPLAGSPGTTEPSRDITIQNVLRAQVTNLEYNGITTDGDYSLTIVGDDGSSATSDVFAAVSKTAAQICAGIVAGCLSNPTGGYTTSYTDAALALGVVIRNSDICQPLHLSSVEGYTGPTQMTLRQEGTVVVDVASGVTVYRGNKVYFNPTTKKWSNASSGSHVLVEGAQWRTGATGPAKAVAFVQLPSET